MLRKQIYLKSSVICYQGNLKVRFVRSSHNLSK